MGQLDFTTSDDSFEFQSQLLSAATGITQNPWYYCIGHELDISSSNVAITSQRDDGYCAYSASASGQIIYKYTPNTNGLFCIDLTQSKRNSFTVWYNGTQLYSETYSLPQMLSVCNVKAGDTVEIKFSCKANESGTIDMVAAVLDSESFRNAYNILNASTLQLTKFTNTKISGIINCNRNGILYTSIPQNGNNWSVQVDGKDAEITLIGDCMIGVELTEGSHVVTFRYHNKAYTTGLVISLFSFITFVGLWILFYKPDFHKFFQGFPKGRYQK